LEVQASRPPSGSDTRKKTSTGASFSPSGCGHWHRNHIQVSDNRSFDYMFHALWQRRHIQINSTWYTHCPCLTLWKRICVQTSKESLIRGLQQGIVISTLIKQWTIIKLACLPREEVSFVVVPNRAL